MIQNRTAAIVLTFLGGLLSSAAAPGQQAAAGEKPVSVVELSTSEGCSSCPAADRLMPVLKREYGNQVIILAFHVDYWNYLGWKDPFSSPEYSKRQSRYAVAFGTGSVYIPQAIVNGTDQANGSNREALGRYIASGKIAGPGIELSAAANSKGEVEVRFSAGLREGQTINLALVQLHAATQVLRGENGGRKLEHDKVVRGLRSAQTGKGEARFRLPDGGSPAGFHVIAFVQETRSMHILSAREVPVAAAP